MIPCIFDYTDYKKYLAELYKVRKAENKGFSYNALSMRAGFKNKGFIYNVINSNKRLSKESTIKLSMALNHNKQETEYFENLVFFNQAEELKERNYYYEKLIAVKPCKQNVGEAYKLMQDQYAYYSDWRNSAIRSLIGLYPFKDDYAWLAKSLYPRIKPKEVKKSIQLLENLGLIKKGKDGIYKLAEKHITTGKEVTGLAVQNFHKASAILASEAIANLPKSKRNITGITLGISKKTYTRICEEIAQFRSRIIDLADSDEGADRVYQLNFHFFPISNIDNQLSKTGDKV